MECLGVMRISVLECFYHREIQCMCTTEFPMVSQIAHEGHLVRENHIGLGFGAQKQVSQLSVEDLSKNSDPGAVLITERERESQTSTWCFR